MTRHASPGVQSLSDESAENTSQMPAITIIQPLDQPLGTRRLLSDLQSALGEPAFTRFQMASAFAKSGPLLRLYAALKSWRGTGKVAEAVFGVDHRGTSHEALEVALELFDSVYYTHEPFITFHPKMYLFDGAAAARCFVGSNNLTVGGTETNFEMTLCIDLKLPDEQPTFAQFQSCWTNLLPAVCPATKKLDKAALAKLLADGTLPTEASMRRPAGPPKGKGMGGSATRSGLPVKPPSHLPPGMLKGPAKGAKKGPKLPAAPAGSPVLAPTGVAAQGFAIQIRPHHNGEIFLSVTAALQNPAFFGWPFKGKTVPKKKGNPAYPQLDPDPRVNITVWKGRCPGAVAVELCAQHCLLRSQKRDQDHSLTACRVRAGLFCHGNAEEHGPIDRLRGCDPPAR